MAHINCKQMMEYAKEAAIFDKPWERWECRSRKGGSKWVALRTDPNFCPILEYRRKFMEGEWISCEGDSMLPLIQLHLDQSPNNRVVLLRNDGVRFILNSLCIKFDWNDFEQLLFTKVHPNKDIINSWAEAIGPLYDGNEIVKAERLLGSRIGLALTPPPSLL